MNSSNDLTAALNRIAEQHGPSSNGSSPAAFQQFRLPAANGSPAATGIGPSGIRRGRPPSASPDLFYTSSRGASPNSSSSASSESDMGERPAPPPAQSGAIQLSSDEEDEGDAKPNGARPPAPNSNLFSDHDSGHAANTSIVNNGQGSSRDRIDDHLAGEAAINFAEEQQSDTMDQDDDDLWGGPVSPSTIRSSPTKDPSASAATRPAASSSKTLKTQQNKRTSRSTNPRAAQASSSRAPRAKAFTLEDIKDGKRTTFWIEVPRLKPEVRRRYTIVTDLDPEGSPNALRSRRAAAAGANKKNKKLAALVQQPLVISDDEDEDEDETKSAWFDPAKRKQSQQQRKRRADPSKRDQRVQQRLSQRRNGSDSNSDDSDSSASFDKLKIDLSQIPTVPTRKWGTPEPEDASQGLRAAPKEAGPSGTSASTSGTAAARPPPKKPKSTEPVPSFEELFLQGSSTSDEGDSLPPASAIAAAKDAQMKSRPLASAQTERASPPRSARPRARVQEESDDDFVPIARPDPPGASKATGTRTKASGAARAKPAPPPAQAGPSAPRIPPKPMVAPLPSIPLKLPANMHPPTGMVLSKEEYAKEDRRRKNKAEASGGAKPSRDRRKRARSGDSEESAASPDRNARRGRPVRLGGSDSDDFEVVGTRAATRTPPPRPRPKAKPYSGGSRGRQHTLSPPRRYSGGGGARQRDLSITPSGSESEDGRARKKKGAAAGATSKTKGKTKAGPASRSFVMPDSQPRPRKKLKAFTLSRDKVLGSVDGRRAQSGTPGASSSRQADGMDYGRPDDDSDDDGDDRQTRRAGASGSPAVKTRRQAREADSEEEADVLKRAPKHLRSELNAEAWVYTAGTHSRDVYRDDLDKLRRARDKNHSQRSGDPKGKRKARRNATTTESDTSDSYAASTGESSLSSESRFKNKAPLTDFVVDDDDQPVESLGRRVPRQLSQSQRASAGQGRPSGSRSQQQRRLRREDSDSDDGRRKRRHKEREREMQPSDYIRLERERERGHEEERLHMDLKDAYWWEAMWLILHILGHKLPPEDLRMANHARRMLSERMSDGRRNLLNMAIRKNFQWYLKTFPKMMRITLTTDEVEERTDSHGPGCGMCRRTTQRPESRVLFYGQPYGPDLNVRTKDEISSSDCNSEQEKNLWVKQFKPLPGSVKGKKNYWEFFVGSKCAVRAELLHKVMHWEVAALAEMNKQCGDRILEWADRPETEMLEEVQKLANDKYLTLQRLCERFRTDAMDFDRDGR
ncbi:hypothetical protein OC834_000010 [Tilletia horrida]|nr:hypothetical protein OC834_000010 [Tilletia horrida]